MPRIGILTFHHANNYGAVLQAYGLSRALLELGHDVQVIDYRPETARNHYEGRMPRRPRRFCREYLFRRRFNKFRKHLLPLSQTYLTAAELAQSQSDFDVIVCGSDQVWNVTSYRGYDPAFFLNFVQGEQPKRVSYAASFGGATETDLGKDASEIGQLLNKFDHISVRDAQSLEVLSALTSKPVSHVLDPVFLTDFDAITPPRLIDTPYIFSYCMNPSDLLREATPYLSRTLNLPVVSAKTYIEGTKLIHPGPLEWLSLLRHADFVCTDSFHGTCFSIKDKKPFVALPSYNGMSRIVDLLDTAALSDRVAENSDDLEQITSREIDFEPVSPRIEAARSRSLNFLSEAID